MHFAILQRNSVKLQVGFWFYKQMKQTGNVFCKEEAITYLMSFT